ncbi:hypothetical protein E2562_036564 [Oryza meyeriana var. granulata]|uniref:Nucleolar complex-associated protein 3 N-terminal domain-containing protein n=1 Tax=Oryza meyeriana var. granulata TaxID=110450 RepID=A0A6G1ECD9_9ORYZ|nr:hypothetical protein E2562_036564 [Oryza meyeriana var. granulata]
MLNICNDKDQKVVKLGLMSFLAVFRDIIPSYRIRQLTEKEPAVEVSKDVKKMRYCEYTLLRSYKMKESIVVRQLLKLYGLIADHVKLNNCQLHPDSIEVDAELRAEPWQKYDPEAKDPYLSGALASEYKKQKKSAKSKADMGNAALCKTTNWQSKSARLLAQRMRKNSSY